MNNIADVELVIKIPEEEYSDFCERYIGLHNTVINAMCNAKPLPKGHGRLLDADELLNTFWTYCREGDFGYHQAEDLIKSQSAILEAYNAESEDEE